ARRVEVAVEREDVGPEGGLDVPERLLDGDILRFEVWAEGSVLLDPPGGRERAVPGGSAADAEIGADGHVRADLAVEAFDAGGEREDAEGVEGVGRMDVGEGGPLAAALGGGVAVAALLAPPGRPTL